MKKEIEFDANMRAGTKSTHYPVGWIPVPDDLYEQIPTHLVDGLCESVERFHVTLSPACPVSDEVCSKELDYREMYYELMGLVHGQSTCVRATIERHCDLIEEARKAKHTSQGDPTGVKKEET